MSVADALTAWSDWAVEPHLISKPIFACNLQSGSSHSVVKVCAQLPQDAREFVIPFIMTLCRDIGYPPSTWPASGDLGEAITS